MLERGRARGFLGPGALLPHVRHALGFCRVLERECGIPASVLDLGSGGGLPGLVLAERWPGAEVVLLEGLATRAEFLRRSLGELDWGPRARVWGGRAEEAGRSELRGTLPAVVARSFARPAVTAECGAPLLAPGGVLVVSDPPAEAEGDGPGAPDRWPAEGLARVGLVGRAAEAEGFSYRVLRLTGTCPDRFPRRVGVPAKRPLF